MKLYWSLAVILSAIILIFVADTEPEKTKALVSMFGFLILSRLENY
jgi:hypothetical protein